MRVVFVQAPKVKGQRASCITGAGQYDAFGPIWVDLMCRKRPCLVQKIPMYVTMSRQPLVSLPIGTQYNMHDLPALLVRHQYNTRPDSGSHLESGLDQVINKVFVGLVRSDRQSENNSMESYSLERYWTLGSVQRLHNLRVPTRWGFPPHAPSGLPRFDPL